MRLPVFGCTRCGSDRLRVPSVRDGVLVGLGQNFALRACDACGHVGVALEFDSAADREAFARAQRDG